MKTLLYVVNDARYFLTHRSALALKAQEKGYVVHVITPVSKHVMDIRAMGFIYHPIKLSRSGMHPLQELSTIVQLFRLYRKIKPDIVHHITIKPICYGSVPAILLRVPKIVNTVPGLGEVFIANHFFARLRRVLVRGLYRFAFCTQRALAIFQNSDDEQLFLNHQLITPARSHLIKGSGVNMRQFVVTPLPGKPVVTLASRMLWTKGVGEFVQAARLLKDKTDATFILAGEPDPKNPASISRAQLQAWHEEGIVQWVGFCDDIQSLFSQSSMVCLPSYREGVPKVLIEAAACGRAIVTTDVPGCREIVRDGENGFLVPAKEAILLAEKINVLLQDPALQKTMGTRSREIAESEFSLRSVIERTLALY